MWEIRRVNPKEKNKHDSILFLTFHPRKRLISNNIYHIRDSSCFLSVEYSEQNPIQKGRKTRSVILRPIIHQYSVTYTADSVRWLREWIIPFSSETNSSALHSMIVVEKLVFIRVTKSRTIDLVCCNDYIEYRSYDLGNVMFRCFSSFVNVSIKKNMSFSIIR